MTKKTKDESKDPINITPSSVTVPTAVTSSPMIVVATPMDKDPLKFNYDSGTSLSEVVKHSAVTSGMNLEQTEVEIITETLERSRGLIDGGAKLSITLPDFLGGGGLQFERQPQSTNKTTKKVKYKTSKK